jgi:hypothetical protein
MKNAKIFLSFMLVCVCFLSANATNYYFSSSDMNANDNNPTSSQSTPWKSITKLNSRTFAAGDTIFFKCGDSFRGNILLNQSGNANSAIVFTSYGTGNKPIISGAEIISNWAAAGTYYTANYTGNIDNFFVNGKEQILARYPNEGSYLTLDSAQVSYLKDASLNSLNPNKINGSKICVHSSQWSWEKATISAFSGTKISFGSNMLKAIANYGYFLYDNLSLLDTVNEWKYDVSTHILYYYPPSGVNPNSVNCEAAVYQNGIEFGANVSYVKILNLAFAYQLNAGVQISSSNNRYIYVDNCSFSGQYKEGVNVKGRYCKISNSYFREIDGMAVYVNGNGSGASEVHHNIFRKNGVTRASGLGGQLNGTALMCASDSNYFHHNDIDSTGYCGISADGAYNLVERNIINNAMLIENDGAAIKGWGAGTTHSIYRNNIILNSDGNTEGAYQASFLTPAIYFDFKVNNCIISENTVYNHAQRGIFQNSSNVNNTITANVILGGSVILDLNGTNLASSPVPITGMTIKHNSFFAKDNNAVIIRQVDYNNTFNMGVIDSNYYFQPYNNNRYGLRMNNLNPTYYSFTNWQSMTGNDLHTKSSFVNWTLPTSLDTLVINPTDNVVTINLGARAFLDLDSNLVCGTITLQPYTSKILINQQTTCTPSAVEPFQNSDWTLNLYPNPAADFFAIESNLPIAKIEIMDYKGNIIRSIEEEAQKIAVSDLAAGFYLIKCTSTKGQVLIKKGIKE